MLNKCGVASGRGRASGHTSPSAVNRDRRAGLRPWRGVGRCGNAAPMSKLFSVIFLLLMIAHLIRPFGVPGLRKRGDFWKLALLGIFAFMATVLIRPQ